MNSTPLIAFDQHAATTVAAVLLPGQQTPALHSLTSDIADSSSIRQTDRASRGGAVLLRGGAVWFRVAAGVDRAGDSVRRDRAGVDSAPAGRPRQNRSPRRRSIGRPLSGRRVDGDPHPDGRRRKPPAICSAAAKISARTCCARAIGCRSSSSDTAAASRRRKRHGRSVTRRGCAGRHGPSRHLDQTHRAYLRAVDETVARLRAVEEELRALLTLDAAAGPRPTPALLPRYR